MSPYMSQDEIDQAVFTARMIRADAASAARRIEEISRKEAYAAAAALCREADPEWLGRLVRAAWVTWARRQPSPKASWLVPWDDLGEIDKEADRCIGRTIAEALAARIEALGAPPKPRKGRKEK